MIKANGFKGIYRNTLSYLALSNITLGILLLPKLYNAQPEYVSQYTNKFYWVSLAAFAAYLPRILKSFILADTLCHKKQIFQAPGESIWKMGYNVLSRHVLKH